MEDQQKRRKAKAKQKTLLLIKTKTNINNCWKFDLLIPQKKHLKFLNLHGTCMIHPPRDNCLCIFFKNLFCTLLTVSNLIIVSFKRNAVPYEHTCELWSTVIEWMPKDLPPRPKYQNIITLCWTWVPNDVS